MQKKETDVLVGKQFVALFDNFEGKSISASLLSELIRVDCNCANFVDLNTYLINSLKFFLKIKALE